MNLTIIHHQIINCELLSGPTIATIYRTEFKSVLLLTRFYEYLSICRGYMA